MVSSANILNSNFFDEFGRSFIYKGNSKGPSVDPCGIPHVIFLKQTHSHVTLACHMKEI